MPDPLIQVPFSGGPNETIDPRLLPPGSVISATNQVYALDGSYQVRYGVTSLVGGAVVPLQVQRLTTFGNELLANDSQDLWSYSAEAGQWVVRDTVPPPGVVHAPLVNSTSSFLCWGECYSSGYRVVAWIDTAGSANTTHANVYDVATGALVLSSVLGTSGNSATNLYCGLVGTTAIVTVAAAGVYAFTLQLSTLGSWSAATKVSDATYTSGNPYAMACSTTDLYLAWEDVGVGVAVYMYNASLSLQHTATETLTAGTSGLTCLGMCATTGAIVWVAFTASNTGYSTHNLLFALGAANLAGVTAAFAMVAATSAGFGTSGKFVSAYGLCAVTSTQVCVAMTSLTSTSYAQFTSSGSQVGDAMGVCRFALVAGPVYNATYSTAYALLADPYNVNELPGPTGTYFLVDLQLGTTSPEIKPPILAVLAPSIVQFLGYNSSSQNPVPTINASATSTTLEFVAAVGRGGGQQGLDLFTVDFGANYRWSPSFLGQELYLSGQYYDGARVCETGFASPPNYTASSNTGSGSTYEYQVTWVRVDQAGNVEESAPGPVVSVTSGAPPNVTLTIEALQLTNKSRTTDANATIYAVIYRTQAEASGDSTFYRNTTNPPPAANANTLTAASFQVTDTLSDAGLTSGTTGVLYTMTGELIHNIPETFTHTCRHMLRIWGIGADQRTIWYSQQYSAGELPAWNDTSQITVDEAGEPLIALANLYDKLLIFTKRKIYVVYGMGPSDAGTSNDLTTPQRIPCAAGCIDPRSVVETDQGVFFQSSRGIEMVGLDLSVQFVGLPISVTTATYPICVGAVLDGASSTVRFAMTQAEAYPASILTLGAVVVYDIRRQRWATHAITKGGSPGNDPNAPMQAITSHPTLGVVYGHNDTTDAALIYQENTSTWLDFGLYFVPLKVTTAWIKSDDLQGWQSVRRVRVLAQYYDQHQMSATVNYDYQAQLEVHSWSDVTIAAIVNGSWEQLKVYPGASYRRCEAVQVTLATSAPATNPVGSGRGAGFTGLAFEILQQPGGYRRVPTTGQN